MRPLSLTLVLVFLVLPACAQPPEKKEPSSGSDQWISLFNGKDLKGWTPKIKGFPLGVNHANTFRVENGVLKVSYDGYEKFDRKFGHLFYEPEHSHYIIELEYRFIGDQATGGPGWAFRNSGIMIHGQSPKTMKEGQDFPVSIEVQLLGGKEKGKRSTGNLCTPGTHVVMKDKLVTRHCISSTSDTFRGDQWVKASVEVHGNDKIRHRINGKVVLEYTKPQLDPKDGDAKAWLALRNGDKMLTKGSISLQAESHGCEFRNIRLKKLPATSKGK